MNSCLICQGALKAIDDTCLNQTAWRCKACHAVFKAPQHRLTKKHEKARYDTHQNTRDNEGYVNFLTHFMVQAVMPFISQGEALEFGCGPGPVLGELLQEAGFKVSLYDPFYYPHDEVLDAPYDLITSTEVLEHIFDPHAMFSRLKRSLKPQGILAIMTHFVPTHDHDYLNWWYRRDETHVVFYHEESFESLAKHYGFEILFTDHQKMITLRKVTP